MEDLFFYSLLQDVSHSHYLFIYLLFFFFLILNNKFSPNEHRFITVATKHSFIGVIVIIRVCL